MGPISFCGILPASGKGAKAEKVGEALLSARIANIYWNRIQHEAEILGIPESRILAHTISHEVGHLLLGTNSHSPTGIMIGKWRSQDLVALSQFGLSFSAEQSEFIREEVRRRKSQQSAS